MEQYIVKEFYSDDVAICDIGTQGTFIRKWEDNRLNDLTHEKLENYNFSRDYIEEIVDFIKNNGEMVDDCGEVTQTKLFANCLVNYMYSKDPADISISIMKLDFKHFPNQVIKELLVNRKPFSLNVSKTDAIIAYLDSVGKIVTENLQLNFENVEYLMGYLYTISLAYNYAVPPEIDSDNNVDYRIFTLFNKDIIEIRQILSDNQLYKIKYFSAK